MVFQVTPKSGVRTFELVDITATVGVTVLNPGANSPIRPYAPTAAS